jgi:predicted aconitase
MYLTREEERMASGEDGEAYRRAMEILIKIGDFTDAKRMVPVSWADLTTFSGIGGGHGDSPDNDMHKYISEFDRLCLEENAIFRTPTTLTDVSTPERNKLMSKLGAQLIVPAGASTPHDIYPLPGFGQYCTPGATNINTFCNGALGARGNNEGPIGVRMAALTGRTPEYGYLLDENRHAKVVVRVETKLNNYIDWGILGFYISKTLSTHYWDVPVLTGINPTGISNDDVISFSATMNSPGSITHWLIEGFSPEGKTIQQALGGDKPKEQFVVGEKEFKSVLRAYSPTENKPDIVTVRFPITVDRLYKLAALFEGKKVAKDVSFAVDLTVHAKQVAEKFGLRRALENAGVYVADRQGQVMHKGRLIDPWVDSKREGIRTMVTDSLKDCNAIGQQEVDMVLLPTLEAIVKVAQTGRIEAN